MLGPKLRERPRERHFAACFALADYCRYLLEAEFAPDPEHDNIPLLRRKLLNGIMYLCQPVACIDIAWRLVIGAQIPCVLERTRFLPRTVVVDDRVSGDTVQPRGKSSRPLPEALNIMECFHERMASEVLRGRPLHGLEIDKIVYFSNIPVVEGAEFFGMPLLAAPYILNLYLVHSRTA